MLNGSGKNLLVIFGSLLMASSVFGFGMNGSLGLDLQTYTFGSSLKDTARTYSTSRSRSSHFLDLSLAGPVITPAFAGFLTRASVYGVFFSSSTDIQSKSEYISPDLRSFFAQMTLFPSRPFSLKLHHSSSTNFDLRFESNNRTDYQRLQPELSVVRRYETSLEETGASWQLSPSNKVDILAEYKQEITVSNRIYDFGEDKDIWVSVTGVRGRPTDTVFSVVILNETMDLLTITLYNLDSLENNDDPHTIIITDLPPGQVAIDSLYAGRNYFSVQSTAFNPLSGTIDVTEHLRISIEFRDPATPNDVDQDRTSFTGRMKVGGDGRLQNETYLEHSNLSEAVQDQIITSTNISNSVLYQPSRTFNVTMLTTFSDNETLIDTLAPQLAESWLNQTSVGYSRPRGWSLSGMHSISNATSIVSHDTLISDMQTLTGRFGYPSKRFNHRLDVKVNATLLSDNSGYVNDKYDSEIINSSVFKYRMFTFEPKHQFKLSSNTQKNPNSKSTEIESRTGLVTKLPTSKRFGDVTIKTNHEYRKRSDDVGNDVRGKYIFDISLRRKFENGYKLSAMAINEWETYGGSAPIGGSQTASETIHKSSYKISLQGEVFGGLSVQADFMLISQSGTSIKKIGLSVLGDIPKLGIPIKSFIMKDYRDLESVPRQTQLSWETKTNFRIRQITIILVHSYRRENQLFETYSSNEILARVARSFDVF